MAETKQTNKERLREITAGIEEGIKELFESDRYMQYLRTMSRFHRYSVNNQMLIYMQRPDATHVAGFNKWRDQFGRSVKKGEKGIKIIAPTPFKKKIEEMKLDPDTKAPMLDKDGNAIMEEKEIQIPMFKVVSVFDVAQTAGKPLPQLASDLTGDVRQYEVFMEALRRSSPVPMEFRSIDRDTDGYFSRTDQNIVIREGMSEVQTVSAAVHEIAHAKLHNYEKEKEAAAAGDENAQPVKPKDRRTEEVEAESISYAVCQYYGIQTGENSFGYIAGWSKGKELTELRASLETINKTAGSLISDIDRHFAEICKERGIDLTPQQETEQEGPFRYYITEAALAHGTYPYMEGSKVHEMVRPESYENDTVTAYGYIEYPSPLTEEQIEESHLRPAASAHGQRKEEKAQAEAAPEQAEVISDQERLLLVDEDKYLHIQQCDEGYDYTIYNKDTLREIDGGRLDMPDVPISTACLQICELHDMGSGSIKYAPLDLLEEIQAAEDRQQAIDVAEWERQNPPSPFDPPTQPGQEEWSEPASPENAPEQPDIPSDTISDYLPEQKLDEYPMPDPQLTVGEMRSFGYLDENMLPLSRDMALEYLEMDMTVYMLHGDNTEAMAFDAGDILAHDGYFGIDRAEWEDSTRFSERIRDRLDRQEEREAAFLSHEGDCFALYQLRHDEEHRYLRYEPLEHLRSAGENPERGNYDLIYTAPLTHPGDVNQQLNHLWEQFNTAHPADYQSPSMSISDIVAIKQDGAVSCHYVDRFGFAELPGFLAPDNPLKNAEMSLEDDYGMIDGIINNGSKAPTVADLEAQVKAGGQISLLDLANAVQRERQEKKPSVLEQLKKHQPKQQEQKKTAPKKSAEREL